MRTIVLLVACTGLAFGARAQESSTASHTVTLKRMADTRVSGPVRVPINAQALLAEPAPLRIASNVDLLKIVFSLVEPADPSPFSPNDGVDPSAVGVRELHSLERRIHPSFVDRLDLKEIVSEIPDDIPVEELAYRRRLVVTITE